MPMPARLPYIPGMGGTVALPQEAPYIPLEVANVNNMPVAPPPPPAATTMQPEEPQVSGPMGRLMAALQRPEVQRALLAFGAQALQPRAPGEGQGAAIGRGLQAGVNAYDRSQQQQAAMAQAERAEDRADTELLLRGRDVAAREAQVEGANARGNRELSLRERMAKIDAETAASSAKLTNAQAAYYDARAQEARRVDPAKPSGQNQQFALRLVNNWREEDPGLIDRMGGQARAEQLAFQWTNAISKGKSTNELYLDLQDTFNAAVAAGSMTAEEAERKIGEMVRAHARTLQDPAEAFRTVEPPADTEAPEETPTPAAPDMDAAFAAWRSRNPDAPASQWLEGVRRRFAGRPELYDAAVRATQR